MGRADLFNWSSVYLVRHESYQFSLEFAYHSPTQENHGSAENQTVVSPAYTIVTALHIIYSLKTETSSKGPTSLDIVND